MESSLIQAYSDTEMTIKAFVDAQDIKPSSRHLYARILRAFFAWVRESGRVMSALTIADIIAYKEALFCKKKSSYTVASHINSLRRFYEWAEANKYYPNIAKGVHAPKRLNDEFSKKPLSVTNVGVLLDFARSSCTLRDYALINLMSYTGLRCVEVMRADVGDITYIGEQNTRVLMVQGKGHDTKDDWVILTDNAYKPLESYLNTRKGVKPTEPLFVSQSNNKRDCRLTTRSISGIIKSALKSVGLDNRAFTAHSLRHTVGTNILRAGGTLEQAQQTLRHSNPATTQIYVKMALKERRLTSGGEVILDNLYNTKQ